MKILTIGDPHGDLEKIKKIPIKNIDLILVTGDIGKATLARKRRIVKTRERPNFYKTNL
jgi:Icc-related predicted phosphoesterase